MSTFVEKTGKSVEEAVGIALAELKCSKEEADIEILEEPNKGLFGLLGNKSAKVRVTLKENKIEKLKSFLTTVCNGMDIQADMRVEVDNENDNINVTLDGDKMGLLIGHRGETLDALQYLSSVIINKGKDPFKRVIIDSKNYRQKREETLIALANKVAASVVKNRRSVTLEPMNPYERRIIHSALQNFDYVETHSVGEEPNRKIVVDLKK